MAEPPDDADQGLFSGRERVALGGAIFLVGASLIFYAAGWLRKPPPTPTVDGSLGVKAQPRAAAEPSIFGPPELIALLSRHGNPPAARFASDFLASPTLRAIWVRYLIDGDLRAAGLRLRRSQEFAALLDRCSKDPRFEAAADAVMAEPSLTPAVDALQGDVPN